MLPQNYIWVAGLTIALVAGGRLARADVLGDPLTGSGDVDRTLLTFDELMDAADPRVSVDDAAFALPAEAAHPTHVFSGRLRLEDEAKRGRYRIQRDDYQLSRDARRRHLPEFDFEFVQDGSHLIPVRRGLVRNDAPIWEWIVLPGRVWQENGDNGFSRASLPFAIIDHNANCVHNGVLMFLFDDDGLSQVRYQITQETCLYFKIDLWGQLAATYDRYDINGADSIRSAYEDEVRGRFPTAPFSQLSLDYPDVDESAFGRGVTNKHMTLFGVVVNGVNYVGGGQTRSGVFPDVRQLIVPSYSTAKSAFAGIAMMWLAERYEEAVPREFVTDYVNEAKDAPGDWTNVTFEKALDMVTGNYASTAFMTDENGIVQSRFHAAESFADKLKHALSYPHKADPGEQWVYHTTDTFIATRGMQQYLRAIDGDDADIFESLVADVYAPIGVVADSQTTLRTYESGDQRGEPLGGLGLFYTADTVAKLTTLLIEDDGRAGDTQRLHPGLLAAAMQRNPSDRGIETTATGYFYKLAFWATEFDRDTDCPFWAVYMSGYGGITIVMLPNGGVYYYFSDNDEFAWFDAVRELAKIVSPCDRRGDTNCDGLVEFADIDGFVAALIGRDTYQSEQPSCRYRYCDINGDGCVDFNDIDPFVDCLTAGRCE